MDDNKKNSTYSGIDLMKILCAILVVALHVRPFAAEEYPVASMILYQYIARIAVPFFFVTSAYFLFRKLDKNTRNFDGCVKYIWRFVGLYLIWSLIYFIPAFETIMRRTEGDIIEAVFLYVQQFFLTGSYLQLWYINASIIAVSLLVILLRKKVSLPVIGGVAGALYMIGLLANTYYWLIVPFESNKHFTSIYKIIMGVMITTRNGIFEAFPFFVLGMFLAWRPVKLKYRTKIYLLLLAAMGLLAEVFLKWHLSLAGSAEIYLFTIPVVYLLFLVLMEMNVNKIANTKYLREMSVVIFYIHMLVNWVLSKCLSFQKAHYKFVSVLVLSCVVSIILIKIKNKSKWFIWKCLW